MFLGGKFLEDPAKEFAGFSDTLMMLCPLASEDLENVSHFLISLLTFNLE